MPKVQKIKSLFKLCKNLIKKSLETKMCLAEMLANERSSEASIVIPSKKSCNQFHQLPTTLLEEIISPINDKHRNPMETRVLEQLITPHLQNLRFASFSDAYLSLFPNFTKLRVLNLRRTAAGDSCLKSIGIYCNELRSLNIEFCSHMTDTGINWLCLGVDSELIFRTLITQGHKQPGLCKTLRLLNTLHTSITREGIQLVLRYIPTLTILDNHHTFDALVELAKMAIEIKRPGIFNGFFSPSILHTPYDKPYKCGSLQQALSSCHSISRIVIYATKGLTNRDLLSLKSIKMLRALEIWSCPCAGVLHNTKITFGGGLAPLLKVTGRSLVVLNIMCLNLVQVSTIAEFCPNLKSLTISNHCGRVTDLPASERDYFQIERNRNKQSILKELKYFFSSYDVPSNVFLFLLSSPALEDARIYDCDTLTNDVLQKAAKLNHFLNLRSLELTRCNAVSKDGIDVLMTDSNSLKLLDLFSCENVTEENVLDWNKQGFQKNWNLTVQFNLCEDTCIYDVQ